MNVKFPAIVVGLFSEKITIYIILYNNEKN